MQITKSKTRTFIIRMIFPKIFPQIIFKSWRHILVTFRTHLEKIFSMIGKEIFTQKV